MKSNRIRVLAKAIAIILITLMTMSAASCKKKPVKLTTDNIRDYLTIEAISGEITTYNNIIGLSEAKVNVHLSIYPKIAGSFSNVSISITIEPGDIASIYWYFDKWDYEKKESDIRFNLPANGYYTSSSITAYAIWVPYLPSDFKAKVTSVSGTFKP